MKAMTKRITGNLYDPRKGDQAVRLQSLRLDGQQHQPARTNYFAIYWIESGSGVFWADASRFDFGPDSLLFFVPYQRIRFVPAGPVRGEVIQFHANFLCVETFHAEVGCSGVLFNDPYGMPVVRLDERARSEVAHLVERLRQEQSVSNLAFGEVMLAYLKVLLILAARLKSPGVACGPGADLRHPVLSLLREMIEEERQLGSALSKLALNVCLMATAYGVRKLGPANPSHYERLKKYATLARKRGQEQLAKAEMDLRLAPVQYAFAQGVTLFHRETHPSQGNGNGGWTVSPHWRRGHWRSQPCGAGRQERKRVAIPSVLVNSHLFLGTAADTMARYRVGR